MKQLELVRKMVQEKIPDKKVRTVSDKYCSNVEIINDRIKIEPLNNYLMD